MIHVFRENEEQLFKVMIEALFFIHCDTIKVWFLGENFNIGVKYVFNSALLDLFTQCVMNNI